MHNIIKERMNLFFSEETSASFLLHNHKRVSDLTFYGLLVCLMSGVLSRLLLYTGINAVHVLARSDQERSDDEMRKVG